MTTTPDAEQEDLLPALEPFGPGSFLWDWGGEHRSALFGPAIAFLQGAHPAIAAAIRDHSVIWTNPYMRAWRSLDATQRWIYGGPKAYDEARRLRDIHRDITGEGFDGHRYHALDASAFAWVWATGWVGFVGTLRLFGDPPVGRGAEEQLYDEFKNLGRIVGVRERCIPPTLDEFETYFDSMLEELAPGHPMVEEGIALFACPPPPPHVPRLLWQPIGRLAGRATFFLAWGFGPDLVRGIVDEHADFAWRRRHSVLRTMLVTGLQRGAPLLPEPLRYTPQAYVARHRARSEMYLPTRRTLSMK